MPSGIKWCTLVLIVVVCIMLMYVLYPFQKETLSTKKSTDDIPDGRTKKYRIFLTSYASKDDDNCPHLLDKKVTDLWFDLIKEYKSDPDVLLDHWTTCRPTVSFAPHEPSHALHLNAYNYGASPDSNGKYPSVTYKGDWSEQSIRDFINNFIYQDRKKYSISLSSCSAATKNYQGVGGIPYPEDAKAVDLWDKIVKDYEPHPDIDFGVYLPCCMSPSNFEKEDPFVRSKPSYGLKIEVFNNRLPSGVLWATRINKTFDGKYDEQSIREFIESFMR